MPRPAASSSGLLLVEAVLSAVVIATGLVFITRGLSGQLRALRSIEEQTVVRALAQRTLLELEITRLLDHPAAAEASGRYAAPFEGYGWTMTATPLDESRHTMPPTALSDVTVTVQRVEGGSGAARLVSVWQSEWTAPER